VIQILADDSMIRNRAKVEGAVSNAKAFVELVEKHGSFKSYLKSFGPTESDAWLGRLENDLRKRFLGLGPVTVYHFMTDAGLPVIKPDRVVTRIFYRLGLIEDRSALAGAITEGRRFAAATRLPVRYVDILFVAYGQMSFKEIGVNKGICLEENPQCELCGIRSYCIRPPR
jgi:DNA-3-methyladenine glycosylase I